MEPCDPVHPELTTLEALVRSPPHWAAGVAGTAAAPPPRAAVAAAAAAAAAAAPGANGSSTPQHSSRTVPIEDAATLSYDRFVSQYMAPNLPVLIRGVADDWRATRDWVGQGGTINAAAVCSRAPLFVPSGWHHTVVNLTDCLSINHNWFNAHNAHWGWALLAREHALATAALEDCRETCDSPEEFEALVQRAVVANAGLDFQGWGALLSHAAHTALRALEDSSSSSSSSSSSRDSISSGSAAQLQALFELQRASRLLRALLSEAARTARRNAAAAAATATQHSNRSSIGFGTLRAQFRDVSLHVEDGPSSSQLDGRLKNKMPFS